MKMTFRWYGHENDTIPLAYIRQIPGVDGVVWALHHMPVGAVWSKDHIVSVVKEIADAGLAYDVVESVNVHEDIKLGRPSRDQYIENYKKTLENLAQMGVKVVCYNFMPIFDWTRTEMHKKNSDGSTSLFYEHKKIAKMAPQEFINKITAGCMDATLPGWEPERLRCIEPLMRAYQHVSSEQLWCHLRYFLDAVIPVAEACGIKMAIHPDDPPWPIFGLPRIITCRENLKRCLALHNSPFHCLTLCAGSLGASKKNDIPQLIQEFIERVAFVHIRNVKCFENGDFIETSHRSCDGDVDVVEIVSILQKKGYSGYVRPDHGRHIWGEQGRPGYGLYDRALGIMYILGVWDSVTRYQNSGVMHEEESV